MRRYSLKSVPGRMPISNCNDFLCWIKPTPNFSVFLKLCNYTNLAVGLPAISTVVVSLFVWTATSWLSGLLWTTASLKSGLVCCSLLSIADMPSSNFSFLFSDVCGKREMQLYITVCFKPTYNVGLPGMLVVFC